MLNTAELRSLHTPTGFLHKKYRRGKKKSLTQTVISCLLLLVTLLTVQLLKTLFTLSDFFSCFSVVIFHTGPFPGTLQKSKLDQTSNERNRRTSTLKISRDFGCPLMLRRLQFQAHVQIFEVTDNFTGKEAGVSGFKHFLVRMAAGKVLKAFRSRNQDL